MQTRPYRGLGKLEILFEKLNKMKISAQNYSLVLFAGDNGVSSEKTSIYKPMNSAAIVLDHLENKSPTTVLLNKLNKQEYIIDVGLASEVKDERVINRNIRRGSRNFLLGDALSQSEARQGIETGRFLWREIYAEEFDIIGVGEIGIASTLCAAALATAATGTTISKMAGRGSSPVNVIEKKVDIISRAFELRYPETNNTIDLLARFGGLEIAALAGFISGAPEYNTAIMLDGFVTSVAALLATEIDSRVPAFLIAPSLSEETGHLPVLDYLGLEAVFDLDINYGEGLAALIGLFLAEMTCAFHIS